MRSVSDRWLLCEGRRRAPSVSKVKDQRSSQGIYVRLAGVVVVLSHNVDVQVDLTVGQQFPSDRSTSQRLDQAHSITIPVPGAETRIIKNLS